MERSTVEKRLDRIVEHGVDIVDAVHHGENNIRGKRGVQFRSCTLYIR